MRAFDQQGRQATSGGSTFGFALVALGIFGVLGGSGCTNTTELGNDCTMVRRDPTDTDDSDGIRSVPMKESEIGAFKDFISFGATDCEDLICVRDRSDPKGADPTANAQGFCTRTCIPGRADTCLTGNEDIDEGPDPFECRQLLLDDDTLATLRTEQPDLYRRFFGTAETTYFCARRADPSQTQQ